MDNSIVIALGAVFLALVIVAYLLGRSDGRHVGLWDERFTHNAQMHELREDQREHLFDSIRYARRDAFARAADAVGLWPHRIYRRADLMRHLEALGTAPELGAATPNPRARTTRGATVARRGSNSLPSSLGCSGARG